MSLHPLERHHIENAPSTVQVDGLEFHKACLHRMPLSLRMHVLLDAMAITEPGWIDAARELGTFSMLTPSSDKSIWFGAALHPMEQFGLAALVTSLVRPNTPPMGLRLSDPHNGDPMPARSGDDLDLEWSAGVTQAFRRVLSDFSMDHATAASSFRRQPAKSWSPENRAIQAQFDANAAILLAAACAGGDTEGVRRIVQDFPGAMNTPLTAHANHGGGKISPVMLAARHNRVEVLEMLVQLGWDPLSPLHWHNIVVSEPKSFARPNNRLVVANDAFEALSSSHIDTINWHPSTVEFFLKAFNGKAPESHTTPRLLSMAHLSHQAIKFERHKLTPAFLRQGIFVLDPFKYANLAAEHFREDVLDALQPHIDWSRHVGESYLPGRVILGSVRDHNGKGATAPREALAHKLATWYIDAGRADLVTQPTAHQAAPGQASIEAFVSPTHHAAAMGLNSLVLLALEHGSDPNAKHSVTGRTVIDTARSEGHQDTEHLIRSFQARQAMLSALQEEGLDAKDSHHTASEATSPTHNASKSRTFASPAH